MSDALLNIPCTTIKGEQKTLADFGAKALLVVNTASQCGFTPQYKGLESIWRKYRDQGLVVLGFPCNQFGKQEPGNEKEISQFCELNFGVSFPLFRKIDDAAIAAETAALHARAARRKESDMSDTIPPGAPADPGTPATPSAAAPEIPAWLAQAGGDRGARGAPS